MADHPIKRMLDLDLRATVNSDDPAYFGGYVNANFAAVVAALDLDKDQIKTLARNSFRSAFLDESRIRSYVASVEAA